jgi:uncharacterized protein YjbI with pentapeptide repeats
MKVLKPQRLSVLQRVVEHRRRCTLVVSVLVYVPLAAPRRLLTEMTLWKDAGAEIPSGVLDEAFPKPHAEVLVTGHAFAHGAGAVKARVALGALEKTLAVFGDRYWKNGKPSDPRGYDRMPIDWAHAFGGEGFAQNPLGKGVAPVGSEHGPIHWLPNVEDPKRLIASKADRPAPAGFGAYEVAWPQRFSKVGSRYDQRWLETLFPGPAEDFDATFYNVAPEDQRIDGFFSGDEAFVLEGLHPDKARIEGKLEKLVVRAFVTQRDADGEHFRAIATRIDTVHFLPHLERAVLVFRGTLPVAEDDADDIEHLMVAAEDPEHPKTIDHYCDVLRLRLDKDKGALAALKDQDLMPPETDGWAARLDAGDLGEMTRLEHLPLANAERGRKKKLAEAKLRLTDAGFDVSTDFAEEELEPPPDPYDIDAVMEYAAKMEARGAELQKEAEAKKQEAEKEARARFAEAGWDWDAEAKKALEEAGGPPRFSADEQLGMLHEMARIADEGGQPLVDLERDLSDPRYEEMLRDLEARTQEAYRQFAHYMPAALIPEEGKRHVLRARVVAAIDAREPLTKVNLTGADLHGLDLSGMDLSEACLEGVELSGAVLRDADLSRAVLARANLEGADLSGARMHGTNLGAAVLLRANLSEALLDGAVFAKSVLDGAVFAGARLRDVEFFEADFGAADFSHVDSEQLLFLRADLSAVCFTGAKLVQCRFIESTIIGVDFTGCDLTQAQFITCNVDKACFVNATLDGAVAAHGSSMVAAVFSGASLRGANLRTTSLEGADFERAHLDGADLSKCNLRGGKLRRMTAREALLMRTDFSNANLRGADLLGAIAQKAILLGADLTGANLARSDLSRVRTDGRTKMADTLTLDTRVEPRHDGPR